MPLGTFISAVSELIDPCVLELGTKQSIQGQSTTHKHFVPHASQYLGTDIAPGEDVDFVADLHHLSAICGADRFDAVISCSTFEHLRNPWLVAFEISRVLDIGGLVFVQTHSCFPLHGYPDDYFRFSTSSMKALFNRHIGFDVLKCAYEFPCQIIAPGVQPGHPSFLNVCICARKISPTPLKCLVEYF